MSCNDNGTASAVIRFDRISKRYLQGTPTLRRTLGKILALAAGGTTGDEAEASRAFWALRDVSFEVKRGETLGIIGGNGAGKSTILKLIAGITGPTSGTVAVAGRVASLIELGAGFNYDLSGRENIYLNGAVLGLKKREIDERFGDIVEFSGLERFLHLPVKYYSSGMYARLGFAIAAHTRSEIILADEILAVGDMAFHQKCVQKVEELRAYSTIVFVSHDLPAVKSVCTQVVWLHAGQVRLQGPADVVIDAYCEFAQRNQNARVRDEAVVQVET